MAAKVGAWGEFAKGLWKENPIAVILLGLCPTMAVSITCYNGLGMGLAATFVLVFSNVIISAIRKIVPRGVRIAVYIVVIATFVTIVDLLLKAYLFELSQNLGIFVPLIVVNCIILGRAEAFASKNTLWRSALDGLGMGAGFTIGLVILGTLREVVGSGTITLFQAGEALVRFQVFPASYPGILVVVLPPGAFIALGLLLAGRNAIQRRLDLKS